jgi:hypothetical protein
MDQDFDALLKTVLPFAEDQLRRHGEFQPFGATMSVDGTITHEMANTEDEQPKSAELVQILIEAFRMKADQGIVRATAICFDVCTVPPGQTEKTDAIRVGLDHRDGKSVDVLLPYRKGWFGRITFRNSVVKKAEPGIFGYRD